LGWVALFPFIQPEQSSFRLNLAQYEQRVCASIMISLSGKEVIHNLRDISFVHEDGTPDPLTAGLPRSWEDISKMPPGGVLGLAYQCAPEDRNYQCRRQMYTQYGFRKMDTPEDDVMWWAALEEAPKDVLDYLQWITAHYAHPQDCFTAIDGDDGNKVISRLEFEASFKDLDCKTFKGKEELNRINSVFRYLDPSGEGQVSQGEWDIMTALWKEINMSITEFFQFCIRMFGEDLTQIWNFMDADGSGEINLEEWTVACRELSYFGPTEPIFRYLDADCEGTVSIDEFMKLENFRPETMKKIERRSMVRQRLSQATQLSGDRATNSDGHSDCQPQNCSDSRPSSRGTMSAPGSRPVSRQQPPSLASEKLETL